MARPRRAGRQSLEPLFLEALGPEGLRLCAEELADRARSGEFTFPEVKWIAQRLWPAPKQTVAEVTTHAARLRAPVLPRGEASRIAVSKIPSGFDPMPDPDEPPVFELLTTAIDVTPDPEDGFADAEPLEGVEELDAEPRKAVRELRDEAWEPLDRPRHKGLTLQSWRKSTRARLQQLG